MSKTTLIGLVGAGGFAREIMPLLHAAVGRMPQVEDIEVCFVDLEAREPLNGARVLSEAEFLAHSARNKHFNIAVGDSQLRERVANRLAVAGVTPFEIRAASAEVLTDNRIGEGAILCGFTTITANAVIGRYFHANLYAYVAHDCRIGDFVTFAPGVMCNGNVVVEDHAYIGAGAVLRHGTPERPLVIGRGAVVGMGAVVTKDVAPGVTVVGNPARPLASS